MTSAQQYYDEGLKNLCKSEGNKSALWYGQAVRDFTKAIETNPNFVQAYTMRAKCYAALGEMEKVNEDKIKICEIEANVAQHQQWDHQAAQAFCQKACEGMERGGLISDSLYYLQKAIDSDPNYVDAYDARSDIYFNLQMADESLADIKRVGEIKRQQKKPWWKQFFR